MNKGQAKNNGVLENPPIAAQRKSNSNRKGKSGEQKAHSKKAACSNQRERLKNSKREVSSQQHGNQQGANQYSPILRTEMGNGDWGRHAQAAHRFQKTYPNGSIPSNKERIWNKQIINKITKKSDKSRVKAETIGIKQLKISLTKETSSSPKCSQTGIRSRT